MATGGTEQASYSLVKERTVTLNDADESLSPNETPMYYSIVICQDKLIVVDTSDGKVKIYRLHDGKFLDKLDSDSKPRAICLMDNTKICVLHDDGLIKMVSIKHDMVLPNLTEMENSFHLHNGASGDHVFDEYGSVARVNDKIVVVGVKEDMTYWGIVLPNDGYVEAIHPICKNSIRNSVTTKDNNIYILCDTGDIDTGVYGFSISSPSKCENKYIKRSKKQEMLISPTSIVIKEDGNIFVGNLYSCIHQLKASCELVAILTQGIPQKLQAMFWDNGQLYVACWGSRDITVFRHERQEGSHKHSEYLMSHEKKQPIIVKTSKQIKQGNALFSSCNFL